MKKKMETIDRTQIPANYIVCQQSDCPRAKTCLRQLAYIPLLNDNISEWIHLLKPTLCNQEKGYTHYRESTPVSFAKGFTNMQKQMFPGQYERFMNKLIGRFGRNSYFERRRGARLIPPHEQEIIQQALKEAGVAEALPFDAYEEKLYW